MSSKNFVILLRWLMLNRQEKRLQYQLRYAAVNAMKDKQN